MVASRLTRSWLPRGTLEFASRLDASRLSQVGLEVASRLLRGYLEAASRLPHGRLEAASRCFGEQISKFVVHYFRITSEFGGESNREIVSCRAVLACVRAC